MDEALRQRIRALVEIHYKKEIQKSWMYQLGEKVRALATRWRLT